MAGEERVLDPSQIDVVDERDEAHGSALGISEISYSQLTAISVAHATRPPVPADSSWAVIGPRNVGGRITAFSQDASNPLVIYAGSAHGGLWISRDAGDTWTHVGKVEHNFPVGTIAIVPGDSSTVIVGSGSMSSAYSGGQGLFRVNVPADISAAAFVSLAPAPRFGQSPGDDNLKGASFRYTQIKFDPGNPARFWVASQTGLWRFEPTGGVGFVREFPVAADDPSGAPAFATVLQALEAWPDYCTDLAVARDPREDAEFAENAVTDKRYLVVYVAIDIAGVFRGRFDREAKSMKWEKHLDVPNADLYSGGRAFTRVRIALCEDHPSVLYAVFSPNPGGGNPEQNHASFVFRSDNNGDDWKVRGRIPKAVGYTNRSGQADYCMLIEVDPGNPNTLVCGEIDVCLSTDGAATWTQILDWQNYDQGDYSQHADQHVARFDRSDRRRLWLGNDGGLSLARDLRLSPLTNNYWRKRSHGIIAAQFQHLSVHPAPGYNFMSGGGLQDNGSFVSLGGATWMHVGWADGGALAFHATSPDIILASQNNFVNVASIEATPTIASENGLVNPILADLPSIDKRTYVRVSGMRVAREKGPFVGLIEQDPTLAGRCLVAWTARIANPAAAPPVTQVGIAYVVPPPPPSPFATPLPTPPAAGSFPAGIALVGFLGGVGGILDREETNAIEFGPVIVGPPQRVEGWIGTSVGRLLFSLNASSPAGWIPSPNPIPVTGGIPRGITSIAVHPSDSWIVAVATVPQLRRPSPLPQSALEALSAPIVVKITTAGAIGTAAFTFKIRNTAISAVTLSAATVPLNGTLTTLVFTGGAFVVNDTWSIAPDGTVTPAATNTSAGVISATVSLGGRVFLTYDRGTTWTDVTAPTAPLPRPANDPLALSPGPVASLEWDRAGVPASTQLFAGTLAGVYTLPNIPSSIAIQFASRPANIPLGTTLQLKADLKMNVGPDLDCTQAADWSSSNVLALTVSQTGLVTIAVGAVAGNSATITVRRGLFLDFLAITVVAPAAALPVPGTGALVAPAFPIAWRPFGKGMPLVLVNDLTFVPGTRRLRAATFGRGIYDIDLAGDTNHRLYIRQTVIEDGRTYPRVIPGLPAAPGTPLQDPRLPQVGPVTFALDFVHAFDIRVDAAPLSHFDDVVDGVEFDETMSVDNAVPFATNFVYVQVSTTGVAVTDPVNVYLFARISPTAAPHTAVAVPMPALGNVADVYPPGDPTKPVAPWVRIGASPTVLRNVGPGKPVIARFTWTPDTTFADQDVALLAICTTINADDRLPAAPVAPDFATFITAERRAALRIVHVAPRPAADLFIRDGATDDTRVGGYPVGGRSPDIMVVRPDITGAPADAFTDPLARRLTDTLSGTGTNFIYVRVHNRRRFETKANVKVFAIALDNANAPIIDRTKWTELPSAAAFANVTVPASGIGFATVQLPTPADPNPTGANKVYLLLALIQAEDVTDPLPNKDRVDTADAFWELVSKYADSDNAAARAIPWVP